MLGVLIECDPNKPGIGARRPIYYEGIPGKYGRFENPRTPFEEITIIEKFDHEMIKRYVHRPNPFLPPVKPKNTEIKDVIFNDPATIVLWEDGTKTVVKCQEGDTYSKELGLAMCISKKYLGNKGNFNEVFKKWIPEEKIEPEPVEDIGTIKKHLYDYCKRRACLDCKLSGRKCTIACMTDEEVREAYKIIAEPEEDLDIEPIEPEPEDITDEDLTEALYSYCGSIPCNDCKIPKDEEGGCICIASMDREELLKTYKKIKEDK